MYLQRQFCLCAKVNQNATLLHMLPLFVSRRWIDCMTAPRQPQARRTNSRFGWCEAASRVPICKNRDIPLIFVDFAGWTMQALTESSDLEALRREKRAIIEEERCLKALMDIEKSSGHRKAQMLAALRAEKQRHAAKADYRRRRFTEALENHFEREAEVLREKHDVPSK